MGFTVSCRNGRFSYPLVKGKNRSLMYLSYRNGRLSYARVKDRDRSLMYLSCRNGGTLLFSS